MPGFTRDPGVRLQFDDLCCDFFAERPVMFYEEHGRLTGKQQIFELDSGKDINVVQRLIPHKEVRRLAEGARQQYFFLLPFAVCFNPLFELRALQSQFVEYGEKERCVYAAAQCIFGQCSMKMRGVLRDVGNAQP